MRGWVSLHRCLLDKAIWQCSTLGQKSILITLLLLASHRENQWYWKGEKFHVIPGQFVTSAESISKQAGKGVTRQNVRTALEKFKNLGFLTYETTKTGTLVTIINWEKYQTPDGPANQGVNQQVTNRQPTGNQQVTTINNETMKQGNNKTLLSEQFSDDSLEVKMSQYMAKRIKESYPSAILPTNYSKWCITFRRLMEIDKRSTDDIRKVMTWVYQDDFWAANIRSPEKLRSKWDTLWLQMNREKKKQEPKKPKDQLPTETDVAYIDRKRVERLERRLVDEDL